MGYNFALVPKTKESRLNELMEIESISQDLAKKEIAVGPRVLQKAIIYDNERDILRKFGKKPPAAPDEDGTPAVPEEPLEFEVKYPGIHELLLENPFAKKEKASKKKKKK